MEYKENNFLHSTASKNAYAPLLRLVAHKYCKLTSCELQPVFIFIISRTSNLNC